MSKSHVEDLMDTLKDLLNKGLHTLQVATQEEVDPTTTLATLANLVAATSRAIDHSSESIAQSALEDLRQLSLHSQELQKKLSKYNSRGNYLAITSTVVGGFVAFAMAPVGLIPVQSLPQLFSTVWKERITKPLEEKIKVVEANRFMIHDMIIKVGKMKDIIKGHVMSLVAKLKDDAKHHENKLSEELEKALLDSLNQLQMVELELAIGNLS